jgi:hypothetical protein
MANSSPNKFVLQINDGFTKVDYETTIVMPARFSGSIVTIAVPTAAARAVISAPITRTQAQLPAASASGEVLKSKSLQMIMAGVVAAGVAAAPSVAHADSSCLAPMAAHINWDANGPGNLIRFQNIAFVYVRGDGAWTMWSPGTLWWNGGLGGVDRLSTMSSMQQFFSDRQSGGQRFLASAFDLNNVSITRDGTITMHNVTWGFDTTANATCNGNTMTASFGTDLLIITLNNASMPR